MVIIVVITMAKGGWSITDFDSGTNDMTYDGSWSASPGGGGISGEPGQSRNNHFKQNLYITGGNLNLSGDAQYTNTFDGDITSGGNFQSCYANNIFNGAITVSNSQLLDIRDSTNTFGENATITINPGAISINSGTITAPITLYSGFITWYGAATVNRVNVETSGILQIISGIGTIDVLDLSRNGGVMPSIWGTAANLHINTIIGNGTYTGDYTVGRVIKTRLPTSTITPVSAIDLSADLTITNALSISKNVTFAGKTNADRIITLTGGIIESGTVIKYLTLDRSLMDGSYASDTAKYPILKPTLSTDKTLSHVALRLIDNDETNGLAAPSEKNVFCPAYAFGTAEAFYTYLGNYFDTTNFTVGAELTFNSIYVKPKQTGTIYDGLEFSNQLIKAGVGSDPGSSKILATNKADADTKDEVTVPSTRNVGIDSDDGSVTLTRDCDLTVVDTYTLIANGIITTTGKTLTKKGTGTFALGNTPNVITGGLSIDAGIVSIGGATTTGSITGALTMKPTAKLVVNGNASVGSIVLA